MTHRQALFACALLASLHFSGPARAQEPSDDPYLAPKLLLGAGGEAELDTGLGADFEDDLEVSYGLGLFFGAPLHRYFVLGAQLSVLSWQSDTFEDFDFDRNLLFDLAVVPTGRYAIDPAVELYVAIPIGLTLNSIGEDTAFAISAGGVGLRSDVGMGIGYELALTFGARFALARKLGLLAEIGYAARAFTHEVEFEIVGVEGGTDVDVDLGQLQLGLGAYFDL